MYRDVPQVLEGLIEENDSVPNVWLLMALALRGAGEWEAALSAGAGPGLDWRAWPLRACVPCCDAPPLRPREIPLPRRSAPLTPPTPKTSARRPPLAQ